MRLIDADALLEKRNHAKVYSPDMYVIGQGYVMDAKTIEAVPVVHGKWIKDRDTIKCSECGFGMFPHGYFFLNDECVSANNPNYRPKLCQNCGAKMDAV